MNKNNIIKCPYCNYEYTSVEIFLPNELLPKYENVERDYTGKITNALGDDEMTEKYICDECGCVFEIKATLRFESKIINKPTL